MQPRELDRGGIRGEEVRDAHRLEAFVGLQPAVQGAQEVVPVVRVLLPGVLAVEDDRCEVGAAVVRQPIACALELGDHVADRVLRTHVAVHETDPVAQLAVAEDRRRTVGEAVRPIEQRGLDERTDLVALELHVDGSSEHALVGREPVEARLAHDVGGLRRYGALGRPDTARLLPERALVRGDRLLQLERGVVGMRERLLGQLGAGIGAQRGAVVDDERKDRVVVRGRQDLDLTVALQPVIEVRHA